MKKLSELDSNTKTFYKFLVVLFIYGLGAGGVHPVTPTMIIERGLTSSMFGVAFAAMQFTMFLFSPFFGKLANYIPTKRIILYTGIGYTASQVVFMFAYSDAAIIIARMLAGIASAGLMTALPNYSMNTAPDETTARRRVTIYQTVFNVSTSVGYFTGGMLGLISVEAACLAQVIILAVTSVAFYIFCEDDTPYKVRPSRALSLKDANPFGAFFDLKKFISLSLALIFVFIMLTSISHYAYEQAFNYYIKDIFKLTSAYNGVIKAAIAILSVIMNSTVCLILIKKTDLNITILPVIIGGLLPLIFIMFVSDAAIPFAIGYILFSVMSILRFPMLQNLCALNSTPETRNNVMGFYQSMTSVGAIIGAFFAGVIYTENPIGPFVMALISFAVGGAVTLVFTLIYKARKSKV